MLKGDGRVGFAQETRWYFFHETEKTDETKIAESTIHPSLLVPIVEWFIPTPTEPVPITNDTSDAEPD
jgi:hypothetical protein